MYLVGSDSLETLEYFVELTDLDFNLVNNEEILFYIYALSI